MSGAALSVLMVVYGGDSAPFLAEALESLANQTEPAGDIALVVNGPIPPALETVIADFSARLPLNPVRLERAVPFGSALNEGLRACRFALVARMDADDVCRPERFAVQRAAMAARPELALLGSAISEFELSPTHPVRERTVPLEAEAIRRFGFWRNPFNHMSVMLRKEPVLEIGGYPDEQGFEDYELWLRLIAAGVAVANLDAVLVDARIGNGFLARRSGPRYAAAAWQSGLRIARLGLYPPALVYLSLPVRAGLRLLPAVASSIYGLLRR